MVKPLSFSAFVMNTASHIIHGLWRDEKGQQINFQNIDIWIDLVKKLEAGGFDAIFFADVIGLYGNYKDGWEHHIKAGLQIPSNDPMTILSALAVHTKRIGLAFTAAPLQEPPFNFARRVSTLDHVSNGRIAWNIVTNSQENAYRNFGYETLVAHDERYRWADEYVDVLYKLWEGSWEDEALLQDREKGVYANPAKVHKIHHVGDYYRVEGPHLVAPSPQRTPVLFQAGASTAGRSFGARHAEAIFIVSPNPESAKKLIQETRDLAVKYGRHANDIQFYQGLSFVIGATEEEARKKEAELDAKIDIDSILAHAGSGIGIDLGHLDLDSPIEDIETEGIQSTLQWLKQSVTGDVSTVRDLLYLRSKANRIVGTPKSIADQLEKWHDAGIDGINVINAIIPDSYEQFITQVLPILRERGLAKPLEQLEEGKTFRHALFGADKLNERHPATQYRGAFSKE
ncbi:NtaA/DmoA family FMN-dependent monooxygenase [Metasolibacillus meyeri]|uniref:NtaA/DmoA family FMN-dependent monooxygenase n=1 Tax=Metasolibacillus meyeri TaxID=1071052 RepID=UPI000D320EF0|nr:NtaA/DmoA family FMN-dependent monooxygenase [Metasolibacillus meyeri]